MRQTCSRFCGLAVHRVHIRHSHLTEISVSPLRRGAFASPGQSRGYSKSKILKTAPHPLWERACPRWQHFGHPGRTRCLHRGQARLHREHMSLANPASKQAGRSAASTAFDLPAPSGGRVEALRIGTRTREPERSEGRTPGASLFGYFVGVWKK